MLPGQPQMTLSKGKEPLLREAHVGRSVDFVSRLSLNRWVLFRSVSEAGTVFIRTSGKGFHLEKQHQMFQGCGGKRCCKDAGSSVVEYFLLVLIKVCVCECVCCSPSHD